MPEPDPFSEEGFIDYAYDKFEDELYYWFREGKRVKSDDGSVDVEVYVDPQDASNNFVRGKLFGKSVDVDIPPENEKSFWNKVRRNFYEIMGQHVMRGMEEFYDWLFREVFAKYVAVAANLENIPCTVEHDDRDVYLVCKVDGKLAKTRIRDP